MTWVAATLVLPRFVPYSVWYGFAAELPIFVLAGAAVGRIYELIRPSAGPWIAAAWMAAGCTLDLPATASYYADGARPDYREAARYINKNWRDGDRVVAQMTPGLLPYYLKPPARADYLEGKDADEQVAFSGGPRPTAGPALDRRLRHQRGARVEAQGLARRTIASGR